MKKIIIIFCALLGNAAAAQETANQEKEINGASTDQRDFLRTSAGNEGSHNQIMSPSLSTDSLDGYACNPKQSHHYPPAGLTSPTPGHSTSNGYRDFAPYPGYHGPLENW